jgi:hypothetical protein
MEPYRPLGGAWQHGSDQALTLVALTFYFHKTRLMCGTDAARPMPSSSWPSEDSLHAENQAAARAVRRGRSSRRCWWSSCGPPTAASPLEGPLGPPGDPSTVCLSSRLGHAVTIGLQNFTDGGHDAVTIDRVTLGAAHGLKLAGADAVPGRYTVGVWNDFPPLARQLLKGVQWEKRRPPAGTSVQPGGWANVVAGVDPTREAEDSSTGIVLWYHDGSQHYELRTNVRILVVVPPARCRP